MTSPTIAPVYTPQSRCRFAVSQGEITPPVGIYHRMWGAAAHDRAAGVHRPLTATVAVLQRARSTADPANLQILVAIDHCILPSAEVDALQAEVERTADVPRQCVLVTCSHTHAAGLMNTDRIALPGGDLIPSYLAEVRQVVAELTRDAMSRLQDATISYATGRCPLAANRDLWDEASQQWVCGYNPSREADDTLMVARACDGAGRVLGTIVNYACHPTTLAWDNQQISPDYPGAMREVIQNATGAACVFLQGASGDLGPREGFVGDVAVADRNGRQLGYTALAVLESIPSPGTCFQYAGPVVSGATIGTWRHEAIESEGLQRHELWQVQRERVGLSYRPGLPSAADVEQERSDLQSQEEVARSAGDDTRASDLRALVERKTRQLARVRELPAGDQFPYEVVICRIGDAIWIGLHGEPYSQLQTALRARFAPHPIVVMTIMNSWGASYLPPAELYDQGIYQETVAVLAAGSLERLIDELSARITEMLEM